MKYISLFSGIGGFELGISRTSIDAKCIGFSEIDPHALKVYHQHFPTHTNLGDICTITEDQIDRLIQTNGGCDLLVGGFPCTNLTSMAQVKGNSSGLDGPASGLFWTMIKIINWILKHNRNLHLIIENNASMKKENQDIITKTLNDCTKIYVTPLDGAEFGVQTRRRLFWTTFPINKINIRCKQTWKDILLPVKDVKHLKMSTVRINMYNKIVGSNPATYLKIVQMNDKYEFTNSIYKTRWNLSEHSDTGEKLSYSYPCGKSRPVLRSTRPPLLDRRGCSQNSFIIRHFHPVEVERLFWFPDGWVSNICSTSRSIKLLGNSVISIIITYIFNNLT